MKNILLYILLLVTVMSYGQGFLQEEKVQQAIKSNTTSVSKNTDKIIEQRLQEALQNFDNLYAEKVATNNTEVDYKTQKVLNNMVSCLVFDKNKATLRIEPSIYILNRIVQLLEYCKDAKVVVEGHTDNTMKKEQALKLSEDRANAVRTYIVEKGIDKNRITTKGYGSERAITSNYTKVGRNLNNRIEVNFVLK